MARIKGVDIPNDKQVEISLTFKYTQCIWDIAKTLYLVKDWHS